MSRPRASHHGAAPLKNQEPPFQLETYPSAIPCQSPFPGFLYRYSILLSVSVKKSSTSACRSCVCEIWLAAVGDLLDSPRVAVGVVEEQEANVVELVPPGHRVLAELGDLADLHSVLQ